MPKPGERKIGLLVLHGMGSQRPGYSKGLEASLRAALGRHGGRIEMREVWWAEALEGPERRLWRQMAASRDAAGMPIGLRWSRARHFIVHSFADALAYDRPGERSSRYAEVHAIVDREVRALYDAVGTSTPVVVLAHSLGAHVISNYVWDTEPAPTHLPDCDGTDRGSPDSVGASTTRSRSPLCGLPTLAGLVTFGANIPLFSLAFRRAEPIVLPAAGVTEPVVRAHARWLNFLDVDDVLGWPLRALYDPGIQQRARPRVPDAGDLPPEPQTRMHCRRRATARRIRDLPIAASPFLAGLTPLSHGEYWTDPAMIRPVGAWLRGLIEATDRPLDRPPPAA